MRRTLILVFVLFWAVAAYNAPYAESGTDVVYQTSTLAALKHGLYDGETTFGDLRKYGDFGLGTFNALDGEMIALDGRFYQIKVDGKVYPVPDSAKTPFAVVCFFKADKKLLLGGTKDLATLKEGLDRLLPSRDIIWAIRIKGILKHAKVRSVPRQQKPYPGLGAVVKNQTVFKLKNVAGTLVGFRFPDYMNGVNVPGYHFHFITSDRKAGGHVLDCTGKNLRIELSSISKFRMTLLKKRDQVRSAPDLRILPKPELQ